jgi:hypothetical protein
VQLGIILGTEKERRLNKVILREQWKLLLLAVLLKSLKSDLTLTGVRVGSGKSPSSAVWVQPSESLSILTA